MTKEDIMSKLTKEERTYIKHLEISHQQAYMDGIKKGLEIANRPIQIKIKIMEEKDPRPRKGGIKCENRNMQKMIFTRN